MNTMKTMYEAWENGDYLNASNFITKLFQLYQIADGMHRSRIRTAFPEYFAELKY
jgi:hypothetical protein